ncbi:MAG TPA: TonB-dependent receptor [Opitutaceae bacterium]|nr:TonB-dependent receptor [Opitutaceae bacterium]
MILAAHAAYAQTTAPAAEDTIVIEKFQVSAAPAHGYSASETMAGSRVNTKIIDLPYSTVNLTDQFFKDFGTNVIDENMTQIGGLTAVSIGGNFFLRGFNSTSQLRDGFYRLGRYGASNIERMEIIRGPNAAIYGRTSPGGMVNFISLQPKKQDVQDVLIANGGYDQRQEHLKATGSIDAAHKTYYIVSLDQTERRYDGQFDHIRNNEDYLAIRHDFSNDAHLIVSAEYFLQIQHAPQASAPELFITRAATPDNAATTHAIGLDTALAGINAYGPHSELNRGNISYTGEYDKSFNDVWSMRLGTNYYRSRRWDFNASNVPWGTVVLAPDPTNPGSLPFASRPNPTKGLIQEDGGGVQADLLAHYFLFNHAIENNSLLTIDYNDYYRYDPTFNVPQDAAFNAYNAKGASHQAIVTLVPVKDPDGRIDYIPAGPIPYYNEGFVWGNETLSAMHLYRTTSLGGNFKQQMYLFHGRLIAFAGVRYDAVRFNDRDYTPLTAAAPVLFPNVGYPSNPNGTGQVRRYIHESKPNFGFNVKVTSTVHLYGSYSESYFVDQTTKPNVLAGWNTVAASGKAGTPTFVPFHWASAPFKPEYAKGWDYGVKGSFFNERLNVTVGGYYAHRYNVLVTDNGIDPVTGATTTLTLPNGDQIDKGAEFDLNWLPTDNLSITGSFGIVNAKYANFGVNFPEAVGRSVQFVSPENGSLTGKYTFSSGPVKGLDLEANVTYVSSTPTETPTAGDTTVQQGVGGPFVVTSHTDQWTLRTPSSVIWDFGVHYVLPWQWRHIQQTVGLTVHNAFDVYRTKYGSLAQFSNTLEDSRTFMVTYELAHF